MEKQVRYWAVRHRKTQRLLGQSFTKGATWWEPEQQADNDNELPRLFITSKAARNCIIMWAKGRAIKKREGHAFDFSSELDGDSYREWLEWEPVPGRDKFQLEVVPVFFTFGEPVWPKH